MSHEIGPTLPLNLNIVLSGYIPEASAENQLVAQVNHIIGHIMEIAAKYNQPRYGHSGTEIRANILSSPSIADRFAIKVARDNKAKLTCAIPYAADRMKEENQTVTEFMAAADSITQLDLDYLFPQMAKSRIMKWLLDQGDLAIVLWDGKEGSYNGDQWNMLQAAREAELPCIWVDITCPENMYWTQKGYFESLDNNHTGQYLETLLGINNQRIKYLAELTGGSEEKRPWWHCIYRYFIEINKIVKEPVPRDPMMAVENSGLTALEGSNKARLDLLNYFTAMDDEAIRNAENYHSAIYLRSILPLVICFALALGFYVETIFTWSFDKPNIWGWIAAAGFAIHGILSFLTYKLSNYSDQKGWHRKFIGQRYIAEALRLAVHFIPFGIPMGDLSLSVYGNQVKRNPEVLQRLRAVLRTIDIPAVTYDRRFVDQCLNNMKHLVDNQLVYHQNTVRQYEKICRKLQYLADTVFFVSIGVVIARSGIQVLLQLNQLEQFKAIFKVISGARFGINNLSVIKSAANMLALLVPAIAVHFSLKLSSSNFEGLLDSNRNMVNDLAEIKKTIINERQRERVNFEDLHRLSREITGLLLGEVSDWYAQLTGKKISR